MCPDEPTADTSEVPKLEELPSDQLASDGEDVVDGLEEEKSNES